jgi:hypothetical protein
VALVMAGRRQGSSFLIFCGIGRGQASEHKGAASKHRGGAIGGECPSTEASKGGRCGDAAVRHGHERRQHPHPVSGVG